MSGKLPVIDTIKEAWAKTYGSKATIWSVIGLMILCVLVLQGGVILLGKASVISGLLFKLSTVVQTVLAWGIFYIGIQKALDRPVQFDMIKYILDIEILWKLVVVLIIQYGILFLLPVAMAMFAPANAHQEPSPFCLAAILIGFFVGFYVLLRTYVATGLVLMQRLNPLDAVKTSFKATKSQVLSLIGIIIINVLLLMLGAITFGIGLIWIYPWVIVCYGVIYKKLIVDQQTP